MGATYEVVDIPSDMLAEVKEYRSILIEAVADYDENLHSFRFYVFSFYC